MTTTVLELLGVVLLVIGAGLIFIPAAFIVGGLALIVYSYTLTLGQAPEQDEGAEP